MKVESIFWEIHNQRKKLLMQYLDIELDNAKDNFTFELNSVYESLKNTIGYIEDIIKISEEEILNADKFDEYFQLLADIKACLFNQALIHIKELKKEHKKYFKQLGEISEIINK